MIETAMQRAITLAANPDFTGGGNPRVGCVVVSPDGVIVGEGHHRGAGFEHAEVAALRAAGDRARGATLVVTLEPCRHIGRTPPCTDAIIAAGIARVIFAVDDPGDHSGAGGDVLRAAGIEVDGGVGKGAAEELVHDWLHVQRTGRPWMIMKCAMSLDGRVASPDGMPYPITGEQTNADAQALRATVDAIVVGTGTVRADDPQLTVRTIKVPSQQPLRIAIGLTDIPASARITGPGFHHIRTRDLTEAAATLVSLGCERVLIEGGPTLQQALWKAELVDEFRWSISPVLIGAGRTAVGQHGHPIPVAVQGMRVVGEDVIVTGRPLK